MLVFLHPHFFILIFYLVHCLILCTDLLLSLGLFFRPTLYNSVPWFVLFTDHMLVSLCFFFSRFSICVPRLILYTDFLLVSLGLFCCWCPRLMLFKDTDLQLVSLDVLLQVPPGLCCISVLILTHNHPHDRI
jgi:hypothetical protein